MRNRKSLAIGAVVLIVLFVVYFVGGASWFTKSERPSRTTPKQSAGSEVPFTHEGDLWFIAPSGDTLHQIRIEVADNAFETTRGLMDRRKMENDQGMLFVFPRERRQSFWMKNTHISLDIIFVKESLQVESIQRYTVPYSEQSVPSRGPAKYVVEVNAGFSDQYGINDSTRIVFERLPV